MTVGLLIVSHGDIGRVLLQVAVEMLGDCPLAAETVSAPAGCDPDRILLQAREALRRLDSGDGVLVLNDMFGATPSNISCRLQERQPVRVVAGVNLPMLVRIFNYPQLDLEQLADKAVSGGRDGVIACTTGKAQDA
ncbi:MAG TPA: PTS fructose transporter subunit IIA [Gammaproteobacteria bacterium]|nr:PTS fructose transporter subunit IIA [Gammaproteobacteria bacterium]